MKRFNEKKWRSIKINRDYLHEKIRSIGEEVQFSKTNMNRSIQNFTNKYTTGSPQDPILCILESEKKGPSIIIEERLDKLRDGKNPVCDLFDIEEDPSIIRPLTELYREMLEYSLLSERQELELETFRNHGASFGVLEEFAKKHTKVTDEVYNPVIEPLSQYGE